MPRHATPRNAPPLPVALHLRELLVRVPEHLRQEATKAELHLQRHALTRDAQVAAQYRERELLDEVVGNVLEKGVG